MADDKLINLEIEKVTATKTKVVMTIFLLLLSSVFFYAYYLTKGTDSIAGNIFAYFGTFMLLFWAFGTFKKDKPKIIQVRSYKEIK